MSGIKRDKLDAVFSDLVRLRANGVSEYSGKSGPLECCHIYGRRKRSVRWHPLNAVALTHYEHRHFTENPVEFLAWLSTIMSDADRSILMNLANTPRKFTPRELEGLYHHYIRQHGEMVHRRELGDGGYIPFFWPDPIPEAEPHKRKKAKKVSKFKRKVNGTVVLRGTKVGGKRDERAA